MLAQEKIAKYQNPFFRYFLCSNILHFQMSLGHLWALVGPRIHSDMLKTLKN